MDKKSKILLYIAGVAFLISISISFYKYVILKDYQIFAEIPCDPALDNCFVREEEDGSITNYRILSRTAANIPLCDPNKSKTCQAFICQEDEENCEISDCTEEETYDGVTCSR